MNRLPLSCKTHIILTRRDNEKAYFGIGVIRLLRNIQEFGSLRAASVNMSMSYSKAFRIVKRAEEFLGYDLLESAAGGSGGGYSRLSAKGRDFVARYLQVAQEVEDFSDYLVKKYFSPEEEPEEN